MLHHGATFLMLLGFLLKVPRALLAAHKQVMPRFRTDLGLRDGGRKPDVTLPYWATLPFRDLDSKSHKALSLGGENDRVFNDLWGKGNEPVVLNNPYSEREQVSGRPHLPEPIQARVRAQGARLSQTSAAMGLELRDRPGELTLG
jgi:hypothetical protein